MDEQGLEIDASVIGLLLTLHAEDMRHDESLGITGPYLQSRAAFHQKLFEFVWLEEPTQVERYKLVKIVESK